MNQAQVTGVYVLYLLVFGIGLILFALWVFCLLGGPEIGTCVIDTANPV